MVLICDCLPGIHISVFECFSCNQVNLPHTCCKKDLLISKTTACNEADGQLSHNVLHPFHNYLFIDTILSLIRFETCSVSVHLPTE